jgi:DNA-binding transcriptional ArsR family regulator
VSVPERTPDQDLIDAIDDFLEAPCPDVVRSNGHAPAVPPIGTPNGSGPSDEAVLERCRGAANALKFEALYDGGDTQTYHGGDDSSADLALMNMLAFYTQDEVQLERLFSASELGKRGKWRDRSDYRSRTTTRALSELYETYDWPLEIASSLVSSLSSPLVRSGDDDTSSGVEEPEIVWFAELGEPKEREYLVETIGVKGYPVVAFGAGGVAKSFAMLAAGIAIASASGVDSWLGFRVLEHGHVLYLDFELDVEEQHRRVRDLCVGMGVPIPAKLAYLSGVGVGPDKAFSKALAFAKDYEAKAVIIDSMGLAMAGDMEKGKEVLAFHGRYINPLRRAGATPFIVDHEGKLQTGEKHKDKAPFGSAYKAWASRSVLQFVFEEYREESSELDVRVRQTKANFGPKIDPIGVRFTFGEKKVSMGPFDLPDEELLEEESRPVRERILTALRLEGATTKQLQQITGATEGTIRNKLSELRGEGLITDDGKRPVTYNLVSSSPLRTRGDDSDDTSTTTVADLFADPPEWFSNQLAAYHEDPDTRMPALLASVAHMVLGDSQRREDVRAEVEEALGEDAEMEF